IKYTPEQLKKIKSTEPPEGYTASADDLKVGQTVKLWLSAPKETKKSDSTSGDTTDKSTPSATQVNRPRVRMALIQEESDLPEPKEPKQKKKKQ
ncbi:MAG TPA: hypothetical protein VKI65_09120, partial [Gemmataceae bacterium]|nr:hypothetical protein [Gemmataceae bacterium]